MFKARFLHIQNQKQPLNYLRCRHNQNCPHCHYHFPPRSPGVVKIRHVNIGSSVQFKGVYQYIDDSPKTNHHKQTDDAVNHNVFALLLAFLVVAPPIYLSIP